MRVLRLRPLTSALGSLTVVSVVAGFSLFGSSSSSRPITIADLNNTGVDEQKNALPAFVADGHYSLLLPGGKTAPVQTAAYPGVANNRQGRWLMPLQEMLPQKTASDYVWSTRFTLPENADPSKTRITGRWAADSAGRDILVNGKPSGHMAQGAFTWSDFTLKGPFHTGHNILQFVVGNANTGPDGLRVEFSGATAPPMTPGSSAQAQVVPEYTNGGSGQITIVPQTQTVLAGNNVTVFLSYATSGVPSGTNISVGTIWGDNSSDFSLQTSFSGVLPFSHTYTQAQAYTLTGYASTGAGVLGTNTAQVTVVNNPAQLPPLPTVQFSQANYSIKENARLATITVNLSAASQQQVVVQYATSAGTATPGVNYQETSGTLVFNPGDTSMTFDVWVLDDGLNAPDKTVNLTLSNPANATLANPSVAVLTVQDADLPPTVQFYDTIYSVMEKVIVHGSKCWFLSIRLAV